MFYQLQLHKCFKYNTFSFSALDLKFSVGNESVCIDIYISENKYRPPQLSMFYDCGWYDATIGGKLVFLEYVAKGNDFNEVRKFSFITPLTNRLGKGNEIKLNLTRGKTCHKVTGMKQFLCTREGDRKRENERQERKY